MKRIILLSVILCFFSFLNVYSETTTHKGLEITVAFGESEFDDILEFIVKANNTTDQEKTLLGMIYLDTEKYPGLSIEESSTPVYLELPASGTAEDTFYLITGIKIPSPEWYFKVDEVYNFIIDTDFDYDDYPELDEDEDFDFNYDTELNEEEEEIMEENIITISGYWKMEKNEDSNIYGNWSWLFKNNGTLMIEEILGPEARLPTSYEGSYEIKGNIVIVTLFAGSPFPGSFTIQGGNLVAEDVILVKTSDDFPVF